MTLASGNAFAGANVQVQHLGHPSRRHSVCHNPTLTTTMPPVQQEWDQTVDRLRSMPNVTEHTIALQGRVAAQLEADADIGYKQLTNASIRGKLWSQCDHANLHDRIQSIEASKETLQVELKQKSEDILSLEKKINDEKNSVEKIIHETDTTNREQHKAELSRMAALMEQVKTEAESKQHTLSEQLDSASLTMKTARAEVDNFRCNTLSTEESLRATHEKAELDLKAEFEVEKEKLCASWACEESELSTETEQFMRDLNTARVQVGETQEELESLRFSAQKSAESLQSTHNTAVKYLETQYELEKEELCAKWASEEATLSSEKCSCQKELDELKVKMKQKLTELETARSKWHISKESLLSSHKQALENLHADFKREKAELSESLEHTATEHFSERQRFKKELEDMKNEIEKKQIEVEKLTSTTEDTLAEERSSHSTQRASLINQLEVLKTNREQEEHLRTTMLRAITDCYSEQLQVDMEAAREVVKKCNVEITTLKVQLEKCNQHSTAVDQGHRETIQKLELKLEAAASAKTSAEVKFQENHAHHAGFMEVFAKMYEQLGRVHTEIVAEQPLEQHLDVQASIQGFAAVDSDDEGFHSS